MITTPSSSAFTTTYRLLAAPSSSLISTPLLLSNSSPARLTAPVAVRLRLRADRLQTLQRRPRVRLPPPPHPILLDRLKQPPTMPDHPRQQHPVHRPRQALQRRIPHDLPLPRPHPPHLPHQPGDPHLGVLQRAGHLHSLRV